MNPIPVARSLTDPTTMNWIPLNRQEQLEMIDETSRSRPVLIFKHSTRCGISGTALNRLEVGWKGNDDAAHTCYFLDLLRYRSISDAVAERYGVHHESPQVIVIRNGSAVYTASHTAITYREVIAVLDEARDAHQDRA